MPADKVSATPRPTREQIEHLYDVCIYDVAAVRTNSAAQTHGGAFSLYRVAIDLLESHDALVAALRDVLNYWEPACKEKDCSKGAHVEALEAWERARAALASVEGK